MAEPLTTKDLARMVEERSGLKILECPQPNHFAWWHPEFKKYQIFKINEAHPWIAHLGVFAMFRDGEELRVYTVPQDAKKVEELKEWGLRRWYIAKASPCYEVEDLPIEAYVQAIADEWVTVAEGMRTAERERAAIVTFLSTAEADMTLAEAAVHIQDGLHMLEETAEPEPTPTNGAAQGAPSPDGPPAS